MKVALSIPVYLPSFSGDGFLSGGCESGCEEKKFSFDESDSKDVFPPQKSGFLSDRKFFLHSEAFRSWLDSAFSARLKFGTEFRIFPVYDVEKRGFAATANEAIKKSLSWKADMIFLVNDDLVFSDNLVSRAIEFSNFVKEKMTDVWNRGFVFSFPVMFAGTDIVNTCGDDVDPFSGYGFSLSDCDLSGKDLYEGGFKEVSSLSGVLMIAPASLWEKFFPPFDEDMGSYFEDVVFSLRLKKSGATLFVAGGSRAYHYASSSFGLYSSSKTFYLARNSWRVLQELGLPDSGSAPENLFRAFRIASKRTSIFEKYARMGYAFEWLSGDFRGLLEVLRRIFS